ncbi:MAG TPA: 6-hydroxymethylpterin diphosphokinase MptE-like protein [Chlamydiales bacterium]|nr:6-hydroxymethylpterin diphosphokinase MptE-like protein [Chlamydiales bacterium]
MNFPEESEFICVYGWDEALYREALSWVEGDRRVVFVSEEEKKSDDLRVKIYPLESELQIEPLAKKIAWSAVLRKMTVVMAKEGARFREELEKCHLAAGLILSEAADWGVAVLKNGRANASPSRRGMALKGAFAGVPAIVVGAGPSLAKNGHLLRAFEDRALILAGGSALNAIDVEPHFAAAVDPAAPYRQFKMQPFSETPFCYQSRMSAENFSLVHGPKILFPDSSSAALNWIYGEEAFESGWTVGNFLTKVALHMGCDPVVLVGMDFCYTDDRKYAEVETAHAEGLVRWGDVWTQRDWLMAARWTEAQKGPLINATEGGILSLPKSRLETVLEQCVKKWDLRQKVHETIQKLPLVSSGRWAEWDASLHRCKKKIYQVEEEVVYQMLLDPLWQVWRPIFEREAEVDPQQDMEMHKISFYSQVLEEHMHG